MIVTSCICICLCFVHFGEKINEFVFGAQPTFTDVFSIIFKMHECVHVSGVKILISYQHIYLMAHKMHLHSGAI